MDEHIVIPTATIQPFKLTPIKHSKNNNGGKQALAAVKEFLPELIKEPYNLSIDAVVATANRTGGRQAVEIKQQFLEFIQLLGQS